MVVSTEYSKQQLLPNFGLMTVEAVRMNEMNRKKVKKKKEWEKDKKKDAGA